MQRVTAEIRLTNTSRQSCSIEGYPGLRLRDNTVEPRDAVVRQIGAVAQPVALPPGAHATTTLGYDFTPPARAPSPDCPAATSLTVTLPYETGELTAPLNTKDSSGPLMCDGHLIDITPFAATVYHVNGSLPTPLSRCRTADLTIWTTPDSEGKGMSHLGFAVEIINHSDHDCAIPDSGPDLQLVDSDHRLQYPSKSTTPRSSDTGNTVLPASSIGVSHGRYVDGPICEPENGTEKPEPTAYLRMTLPGDPTSVDVAFRAAIYCHGDFSANAVSAD